MPRKYRPRKEFKFWLYHDRDEDSRLMEFIQYCKSTRQFARVVRDGIRLIWSLREGNTHILFELFPHLERQFNPDAEDLIAQFREMLLQQRNAPVSQPVQIDSGIEQGGRKMLSGAKIDLPLLDDDDNGDTIVLTKKTSVMNGSNLIAGVLGLD
ncbi:MAG: hypothetical protein ABI690_04735 [Chloroflexota bacterium]